MKVKANVYVIKDGQTVLLRPGDRVPNGVTVTNPDAVEADAKTLPAPEQEEKPAAKRSSRKADADAE